MTVQYLQEDGSPWTEEEFRTVFGPIEIHTPTATTPAYHVATLHGRWDGHLNAATALRKASEEKLARAAPSATAAWVVRVLDKDGAPKAGVDIVFYWPDAPEDPSLGWFGRGVVGTTNINGDVGFGMGGGAWYKAWGTPGPIGPHACWIRGANTSQMVNGGGMLWCTNHYHFDVIFQEGAGDEPPPGGGNELVRYYDANGSERDATWAATYFGTQAIHLAPYPKWELTELHEGTGDHRTLAVRFLNAADIPLQGVEAIVGPRDVGGNVSRGESGADGYATFSIASDVYRYYVPGQGHWVVGADLDEGNSDFFNAVGWVGGSNPKRWLNPVFQFKTQAGTPPPPPPPPGDGKAQIYALMDQIRALIEEL